MDLFNTEKEAKVILLDYQATLVANFDECRKWRAVNGNRKPYEEWIKQEKMRSDLVKLLKGKYTILITARDKKYREITLKQIKKELGGVPPLCLFNEFADQPPVCKKKLLEKYVYPKFGRDKSIYMAIESNAQTRAMYKKEGIAAYRYDERWIELPKIKINEY